MQRRSFLQTAAVLSAAGLLAAKAWADTPERLDKLGIQLFSLPKLLEKDFQAAVQLLARIGYKEAELYGPYPFSTDNAKGHWNAVTPSLGFSGSGYFGLTPQQLKAAFNENGISIPSAHTDLDTLRTQMGKLAEAGNLLGFTYVVLPAIPESERKTLDDYKRLADDFNKIGSEAKKLGLKFAYHNHGYGLQEVNGQIPLRIILDNTDASLVFLEMDLYWTTAAGADPVKYLDSYPNRYHLMHVKDMKERVRFSGDGGDSKQWIELFPYMTTAGNGVLDLKTIIATAQQRGVKHFFVEQDMVADPDVSLKKSFDYLKSL